jgi:5-dehydro-4-deoxyglucarate dehydratase
MDLQGVLFFPVTPFGPDGGLDAGALTEHVTRGLAHSPGGVFAACGTGELAALSESEHAEAVAVTVKAVGGRIPVLAGAGGSLGSARRQVQQAADAGADGILLLPPYLAVSGDGLRRYVEQVADSADLPLVLYQRGAAVLSPSAVADLATDPRVVGVKDGVGDIDLFARTVHAVRARAGSGVLFFNGLPTAELTVPAYRAFGVDLYSSAVFAFAPEIATAWHRSTFNGDGVLASRLVEVFYAPLVELRATVPGYAVALVKAGVRLRGLPVGGVRAPLVDVRPADVDTLRSLLRAGLEVLE